MYVGTWAERTPDKVALVFDRGAAPSSPVEITYAELDQQSNRLAHYLRHELGLQPGSAVAAVMGNVPEFAALWWAAMRSGHYLTPVNWHLAADEVNYAIDDCGAAAVFYEARLTDIVERALRGRGTVAVAIGGGRSGDRLWADVMAAHEPLALDDETMGASMFYSSGTTGRPKGIQVPLTGLDPATNVGLGETILRIWGHGSETTYLSPGPLYHSSPSIWSFAMTAVGATAVVMDRFDAERALALVERHRVTASQWVPTMFSRLLRLPDATKTRYDLTTHRVAYHASAPCPVDVKRRMIEWWGPILVEFYGGTEGGSTCIRSEEWLARAGSVGRHWTGGTIHVFDPSTGEAQPPDSEGLVYFEAMSNHKFEYHNAPGQTNDAYREGLVTLGDVGYVDDEGYLFLTDRMSHTIISGGVNIYPKAIEEVIASDSRVDDVAVIGVPNDDLGEEVKAVMQPSAGVVGDDVLAAELIATCRERLGSISCPRSVDFVDQLPRDANGKLYKLRVREPYWAGRTSRLV